MADAWIREGDTGPTLTATLRDGADARVNLAGADVTLHMRPLRSTEPVIEGETVNVLQDDNDPDTFGDVEYVWDVAPEAGGYKAFFRVTFSDGTVESFPNDRYLLVAVPSDIAEAS